MKIWLAIFVFLFALSALPADAAEVCGKALCTGQFDANTTTPVKIGTAAKRISLVIHAWAGSNPLYCGPSASVTSSTGMLIEPVAARSLGTSFAQASDDIWCISTGGAVHGDYEAGYRL